MKPLASTLAPDQAADRTWDVLVVGAGCAGAMAARETARRGASVLLVDKAAFPRWKVCGCCINRRAQSALHAAGLESLLPDHHAVPLDSFAVAAQGRSVTLPLPGYVALSRETLDAALARAAIEAGAHFLPKTHATMIDVTPERRTLLLRGATTGVHVAARLVLVADGLGGRLLKGADEFESVPAPGSRIGAGAIGPFQNPFYRPGTVYMACAAGGYVGLACVEDGRIDIGAAFDPDFLRETDGLAAAAGRVLDDAGFPHPTDLAALTWRGTPALTRRATRLSAHRALVLGDAAGYIEPFTGEGMAWALSSGVAIAGIAARAIDRFDASVEQEWARCYRNIVTRRQFVCRTMTAILRHPLWITRTLAAIAWVPAIVRPFLRHVNAPLEVKQGVSRQ